MKLQRNAASAVLAVGVIVCGGTPFATAAHAVSAPWKNCTQVNKRYPHGVGKVRARERRVVRPWRTSNA
ncbi:MAG: hypothetical protein ACXVY6_09385, partial [Gaiellaceae bacterium]